MFKMKVYLEGIDIETYRSIVESKGDNLLGNKHIKNEIFANIWQTDLIIRVDPETGEVIGEIDLSKLYPEKKSNNQVLNGIAYDRDQDRLFVTGKKWSKLFQIKLHDLSAINKKSVRDQSQ